MNNKLENKAIGNLGEDLACQFLKTRGYKIVDRNYLKKYGEIDIVAFKVNCYYFVEVKTVRKTIQKGIVIHETSDHRPEDNIHYAKRKRLARVIQAYILSKKIGDYPLKILAILVTLDFLRRKAKIDVLYDIVL